jgi:Tfp pilus assembly protein PilP
MRALVFTVVLVVAAPHTSVAQGDAAMAAARAATGSKVGTSDKDRPAKPADSASKPADSAAPGTGDAPAAVVATPAAGASPALQARGFTYNPEGRRDPFVNLLRRGTGVDLQAAAGPRPSGLKGLGTGEVTLKGTMASQGAYVAILQGSDSRTYVVHPGEKLFDGTVRTITADSMVILQQVNDPLSKETQREVRKVLRQTEEAK